MLTLQNMNKIDKTLTKIVGEVKNKQNIFLSHFLYHHLLRLEGESEAEWFIITLPQAKDFIMVTFISLANRRVPRHLLVSTFLMDVLKGQKV